MVWQTEYSVAAERDFDQIFDHLCSAYVAFGEDEESAFERAEERLRQIRAAGETLARAPYRGTLHDQIRAGLRNVTLGRAVFWFAVDENAQKIMILAVFFGGQNHTRHILDRLSGGDYSVS